MAPFTYVTTDFACLKFLKTGIRDSSFGTNGFVSTDVTPPVTLLVGNDYNTGMTLQQDKVILSGYSGDSLEMIRYTSQGILDSSFGINGIVKTIGGTNITACYTIVGQSDGTVFLGGMFSNGAQVAALVLKYKNDGDLDTSFNHTGRWEWAMGGNEVSDIMLQPDGRILIATGISFSQSQTGAEVVVRLNTDGSFDTTFNHIGYLQIAWPDYWPVQGSPGCHLALQANGKIVLGGVLGDTLHFSSSQYCSLLRCTKDGVIDSSFGVNGKQAFTIGQGSSIIREILVQPDDKILTAGSCTGSATLARFMPNVPTSILEVPQPNGRLSVYPNPCLESISITGYNENIAGKIQQLQIINSFGQIVYNRSAPIALGPINCTPFPPGVYTLIVRGLHYSFNSKFIRQ